MKQNEQEKLQKGRYSLGIVIDSKRLNRQPSLHEYSLYAMKLRLNESQEELRNDKKEEGLAEDSAPRENLYGIELPISVCQPFNADFDFISKSL